MALDIVCFGEPLLEFNQQPDGNYLPGHGGDTSNCAIAAARQGAHVGYVTRVGDDAFGHSFLELWARESVDTAAVVQDKNAYTGIYFVTHQGAQHAFSYYRAASAASLIAPDMLPLAYICAAKIFHVSGISQAISTSMADSVFTAISAARQAGVLISFDTNLRLNLWPIARARATIHAAMATADIALPGLEDAQLLTGKTEPHAIVDFYLTLGAKIVALTLGARGTLVATPHRRHEIAGYHVTPVDATAAGDTFDGAFLAELVADREPFAAARYANAAAALSTQGYGAIAPIPKRKTVEAFLAKNAVGS